MDEAVKLKKSNKNLELNLSYWLNLVYLGNLILFFNENPHMINYVSQDIHKSIFNSGIKKIKDTFEVLCNKNEFYDSLMKNIGGSIPKITFDPNVVEICKLYTHKLAKEIRDDEIRRNRDSASTCYTSGDVPNRDKSIYNNRRTASQNSFLYDSSDDISGYTSSRKGLRDEVKLNINLSNIHTNTLQNKNKNAVKPHQNLIIDTYKDKKSIF